MDNETRLTPPLEVTFNDLRKVLIKYWIKNKLYQEAEDLAEAGIESCLKALDKWEAREGYQGKRASLKTFLVRVGINGGYSELRREGRHKRKMRLLREVSETYMRYLRPNVSSKKPSMDQEWL